MKERYIPIRPGILEHLIRGTISFFEFGVYVTVHLQANYSTGIWHGSAPRLLTTAPRGANLRQVQRALEHLEALGYLKSFRPQGARGNTAYLIDKFTCRSGARSGYRLNAVASTSYKQAVYELVAEDDAEPVAESVAEHAPYQEVLRKKNEQGRKSLSVSDSLPVADGFEQFYAAYPKHVGKDTAQRAWRKVKPEERDAILARVELNKIGEWAGKEKRYIPNPATWLNGCRWTDEILAGGSNGNGTDDMPAPKPIIFLPEPPPFQKRGLKMEDLCSKKN